MTEITTSYFTLNQFCQITRMSVDVVVEIVELGIVDPRGRMPDDWQFDESMLGMAKKAEQLRRDLAVDWPGVALAMHLIDRIEQLKLENQKLRQRLERFMCEE